MTSSHNIKAILINLDEVFLKGDNQGSFLALIQNQLIHKIKMLHSSPVKCITNMRRKILTSPEPFGEAVLEQLSLFPGIHSFYPGISVAFSTQVTDVVTLAKHYFLPFIEAYSSSPLTFKVTTKRSNKHFPLSSMDLSKEIGSELIKSYPSLVVKMHKPDLELFCYILEEMIFFSAKKIEAVGGLPVGSNGKMLTFLSGGIDSPVASYMMARRGIAQEFVFFHAYPFVGDEVVQKVTLLAKRLMLLQDKSRLHIIPYGGIQKLLSQKALEPYRTLFFRKYMFDCALKLCPLTKSVGVITGDSLGQVSSQTLMNLHLINQAVPITILRPLIGFNKINIIQEAKRIGTYDISIMPHDDACQLFSVKHPITYPDFDYCQAFFQDNQLQQELDQIVLSRTIIDL
jgi:thiamine biosynthesis protein ThiI